MKEDISEDVQVYEVGFHLLSTVPEEKLGEIVSNIQGLITKNGGSIISEEFPKMRTLAYEIKKKIDIKYMTFNKAYFGWVKFETTPTLVGKIDESMESNKDILRHIVVKTVKENTMEAFKASVLNKESKEEKRSIPTVEKPSVEKVEVSKEELDKSIDDLIIETRLNNEVGQD